MKKRIYLISVSIIITLSVKAQNMCLGPTYNMYFENLGYEPEHVITGDINADGYEDIVCSYSHVYPPVNYKIVYALNNGAGGFNTSVAITALGHGQNLQLADVSGDNLPDLIVTNESQTPIYVYINTGSVPIYSTAVAYSSNQSGASFDVSDFNGDNYKDIVINDTAGFSILWNSGNGTFPTRTNYNIPVITWIIKATDVDNNGTTDIGIAGYLKTGNPQATCFILKNSGLGSFTAPVGYSILDSPTDLVFSDFNSDGKKDFVVSCFSSFSSPSGISVLMNTGNGQFSNRVDYNTPTWPVSITVADFNEDSNNDLLLGYYSEEIVTMFMNAGGGSYSQTPINYYVHSDSQVTRSMDLNKDGKEDFITSSAEEPGVHVFSNLGHGDFGNATLIHQSQAIGLGNYLNGISIQSSDFTGDGVMDLAFLEKMPFGERSLTIFKQLSNNQFTQSGIYSIASSPVDMLTLDAEVDGTVDIAIANADSNSIQLYSNVTNTGNFAITSYLLGQTPTLLAKGDLNHDSKPDIVAACGANILVLMNTGVGTAGHNVFGVPIVYLGNEQINCLKISDISGSGNNDIVFSTSGGMKYMLNQGSGTFSSMNYMQVLGGYNIDGKFVIADFDGNTLLDVAGVNSGGGVISILLNHGGGVNYLSTGSYSSISGAYYITDIKAVDANLDGRQDIYAVGRTPSGVLNVYINNGNSSFDPPISYKLTSNTDGFDAVDLNSDAKVDLAIFSKYSSYIQLIYGCDGTTGIYGLDNKELENNLLYPNPADDYISLPSKEMISTTTYTIIDLLGHTIDSGKISAGNCKIYIGGLTDGVYFLKISGAGNMPPYRFIKINN